MDALENRVAALEEQLAALTARLGPSDRSSRARPAGTFWALDGLREVVGNEGSGAVLYTGTVDLPTGEHYEWQFGLGVDDLLEADWAAWAPTLGALGHPVRLQLLRRVLGGVQTAATLAGEEGLGTTGQLYHHLRLLVSAGWLHSATRGTYTVPGERVVPLLSILAAARR